MFKGTTIICVRQDGQTAMAGDGQVTLGNHVMKHSAKKIRRLYNDSVLAGFAGSTADAFSLFELFEGKLEEYHGNLKRAAVELAKKWRSDKFLRKLEAMMIVANNEEQFLLSGAGDVIQPDDGILAIGSGGPLALAAARGLLKNPDISSADTAKEAMAIAAGICIYTNTETTLETV